MSWLTPALYTHTAFHYLLALMPLIKDNYNKNIPTDHAYSPFFVTLREAIMYYYHAGWGFIHWKFWHASIHSLNIIINTTKYSIVQCVYREQSVNYSSTQHNNTTATYCLLQKHYEHAKANVCSKYRSTPTYITIPSNV